MSTEKVGKVAGFVLVIDPENAHGARNEMKFDNTPDLLTLAKGCDVAYSIYTVFEDYDGERERQEGYSILATVGGFAFMHSCRNPRNARSCSRSVRKLSRTGIGRLRSRCRFVLRPADKGGRILNPVTTPTRAPRSCATLPGFLFYINYLLHAINSNTLVYLHLEIKPLRTWKLDFQVDAGIYF